MPDLQLIAMVNSLTDTHQPITPDEQAEDESVWRAYLRFFVPALLYAIRHLTIGTAIRTRRAYLRWRGRKYYI
jgi:hypothetical protein